MLLCKLFLLTRYCVSFFSHHLVGEKLKTDDCFGVSGKDIVQRFRGLKNKQNVFAQNLINDEFGGRFQGHELQLRSCH